MLFNLLELHTTIKKRTRDSHTLRTDTYNYLLGKAVCIRLFAAFPARDTIWSFDLVYGGCYHRMGKLGACLPLALD